MMHLLVQLILVEKADHYGIRFCGVVAAIIAQFGVNTRGKQLEGVSP